MVLSKTLWKRIKSPKKVKGKYSRGEKNENLYQEKWDYLSGWVIEKIPIETGCCRKTKNGVYVKLKVYQYFSWKVYQNRLFSS